MESVKHTFAARAASGIPAFLHALFLEKENKTAEKITGQCFPIKSKVTCKNLAHLEAKKQVNRLKYHKAVMMLKIYFAW